ncbi:MAG: hypothetical protein J6A98_00575 [Clostridia bacterium]|nr:hypothetical protein [Clostridia bacterium]
MPKIKKVDNGCTDAKKLMYKRKSLAYTIKDDKIIRFIVDGTFLNKNNPNVRNYVCDCKKHNLPMPNRGNLRYRQNCNLFKTFKQAKKYYELRTGAPYPYPDDIIEKCCFCGRIIYGYGNDTRPIAVADNPIAVCCDDCNLKIVVPTRKVIYSSSIIEQATRLILQDKDELGEIANDKIEGLEQDIADAKCIIDELKAENKTLKKELAEKETRIAELEDKDWYEGTIKQLEEQNERLITERDSTNDQIKHLKEKIKSE